MSSCEKNRQVVCWVWMGGIPLSDCSVSEQCDFKAGVGVNNGVFFGIRSVEKSNWLYGPFKLIKNIIRFKFIFR